VANPLDRVSVSQRDIFTVNQDGSIDLYVQHQSPGKDKEANWLPCPKEGFVLFMRLYWPDQKRPSILDGSWDPPAVERVTWDRVKEGRPGAHNHSRTRQPETHHAATGRSYPAVCFASSGHH
jgi:Protein of unknown function (DUF1214)